MKKVIVFLSLLCMISILFVLSFNILNNKNEEKENKNETIIFPRIEEKYETYKIIFEYNLKNKTKEQVEVELINKQVEWKEIIKKYDGKDIVISISRKFVIFAQLQPTKVEKLKQNKEVKEVGRIYQASGLTGKE